MKKRALTLFEVIISLALTAILLGVLMRSATRLFTTRNFVEHAKQEVLSKKMIQERLSTLFFSLRKHEPSEKGLSRTLPQGPLESNDGTTLTVWLAGLIDKDPSYCGQGKGELSLIGEDFVFTQFGDDGNQRKEVLLQEVESLKFLFLDLLAEPVRLVDSWTDKEGEFPSHMILEIKSKGSKKPTQFAFFFSTDDNFVVYHPKTGIKEEVKK